MILLPLIFPNATGLTQNKYAILFFVTISQNQKMVVYIIGVLVDTHIDACAIQKTAKQPTRKWPSYISLGSQ